MTVSPDQRPAVLAIFILTYAGLAIGRIPGLKLNRTGIALLGAIAMMVATGNSTGVTASSVNWPTILLLFGFFVISAQLRLSGFYDRVAKLISAELRHPAQFLLLLVGVSAGLSAFLNNDIVCFVLTPVVGAALIRKGINPVPFLVALAVSSNIGAGATLIGNAQNMMIGQVAGLGFLQYMLWSTPPVLAGLAATYLVARLWHRAGPPVLQAADADPGTSPNPFDPYHARKGLVVLGIVIALFFTPIPREIVVLVAAGVHFMSRKFRTQDLLALVDWQVLLIFMALFVVSGTFEATGYGFDLVKWLQGLGLNPSRPGSEVVLTAGMTAVMGNAPAVMLLVKLVPMAHLPAAYLMGVANSFGGNAMLTASVANLVVIQQARRQGIVISALDFARLGLPVTILALAGLVGWAALMGS
jgi:Na+/H+ antiporter NhaD/arsenite permease-like protein